LLLSCAVPALGQDWPAAADLAPTAPQSFVEDAGLQHAAIHGVDFSPGGDMWLATSEGLVSFDGVAWRRHGPEAGLPSRLITAVKWHGSELWVGTDCGAGWFGDGRFQPDGPAAAQRVRRIASRSGDELWVCTSAGTHRRRASTWEQVAAAELPLDIVPLGDGDMLLVTGRGLLRFQGEAVLELPAPLHLDLTMPTSAAVDPASSRLVIATQSGLRVLGDDGRAEWTPYGGDPQAGARATLLRTRAGQLITLAPTPRRFLACGRNMLRPMSPDLPLAAGTVSGLAEAEDGHVWAFGNGVLLRWRPKPGGTSRTEVGAPRFVDGSGRVWFAQPQRVVWQRDGAWTWENDLTPPLVRARNGVYARSRRGNSIAWVGEAERREFALPFPAGPLQLLIGGNDVAWALSRTDGRSVVAWLDEAAGRFYQLDLGAWADSELASAPAYPDGVLGIWLATNRDGRTQLVRLRPQQAPRVISVPEPLGRTDIASDAEGRVWVIGTSGLATFRDDEGWRTFGSRWTRSVDWVRRVGSRVVFGCSHSRDGSTGISVVEGGSVSTTPTSSPRIVGCDARGLYVASDHGVYLVPPSGPVLTLAGVSARDVGALAVDAEGRAWTSADGRTLVAQTLPPPHLSARLLEAAIDESPFALEVALAFAYVPASQLVAPGAAVAWRVDGGDWVARAALVEPLRLPALAAGSHTVELVASDALGRSSNVVAMPLHVAARPLQDRPWFPAALAAVAGLVLVLTAYALLTSRKLAGQTRRLRATVVRRTQKIRSELLRRRRAERHVRHQHRVLGLLATGKPIEQALDALVLGLEMQLPGWRGAICLLEHDRLTVAAAPTLVPAVRALLHDRRLTDAGCPCARAISERRTVAATLPWGEAAAGTGTVLAHPVASTSGTSLGVLVLLHEGTQDLGREQTEIVDAAANIAAVAVDSKRGEAERCELQQQVLTAQKLRSLGLLAGSIAHDFNNLLTGVLGHTGLARLQTVTGSPVDQALAQAETTIARAADLCAQLLAYSGRGRFVVKPIDLSALVQEMVAMLGLVRSPEIELELHLAPDLPAIEADATQVRQVVMNLLTNAAEAAVDAGGRISVVTACTDLDPARLRGAVVGRDASPGRYVSVTVADSGCGMSEATLRNIFEPFFSTKASGRGLGMSAVQGIVQGHRGVIEIATQPGHGTTICALFPATDKVAEALVTAPEPMPRGRQSGTILVAEDDRVVRELAQAALASAGFEVVAVADGASAVRAVGSTPGRFRAAFLDVAMPKLTGYEVLTALRRIDRELPVVLCSGNALAGTASMPHAQSAHFLAKPYGPRELLSTLRRALSPPPGAEPRPTPGGPSLLSSEP